MKSGIYIVTLKQDKLISVNAHDRRIADNCIKVNKDHCKVGKARDLQRRKRDYVRTFGADNVTFDVIAFLVDLARAERHVLRQFADERMRGPTGRKNEWLQNIDPGEAKRRVIEALPKSGVPFALVELAVQ